jgi:hypothetical protein
MRVPIYPQDLNSGSGFARLAKCLKRDWPGDEPIGLSEAQNLLARCFGYSDYHQIRFSNSPESVAYPSLANVVAQCMETLCDELIGGGRAKFFDLTMLQVQVIDWPFLQLSAYRKHYGHSDNRILGQAVNAELIEAFLSTQKAQPEVQPDGRTDELFSKKIETMMRHLTVASCAAYVSPPMGVCNHQSPYDANRPSSAGMLCLSCAPSIFQSKLEF